MASLRERTKGMSRPGQAEPRDAEAMVETVPSRVRTPGTDLRGVSPEEHGTVMGGQGSA